MADATQRSFGARTPLVSQGAVTTSLVRRARFRAAGAGAAVAQHGAVLLLAEAAVGRGLLVDRAGEHELREGGGGGHVGGTVPGPGPFATGGAAARATGTGFTVKRALSRRRGGRRPPAPS